VVSIPLIFPVYAVIARLDPAGTRADPDGAGAIASGYDDDFGEPTLLPGASAAVPVGTSARKELAEVTIPCQAEEGLTEQMQMTPAGDAPMTRMVLTMHKKDLSRLGLITDNVAEIRKGDRLVSVTNKTGTVLWSAPDLYVTEVRPADFGLGDTWNLLLVQVDVRQQGTTV